MADGRCVIRVVRSSETVMEDVLLEEWSHLLRWETPVKCDDDHDAIFWAILGQVTKHWRGE